MRVDIDKLEALEKHAPTKLPDGEWCLACWGMDDAHARWPCLVSRLQGEVRELRVIAEALQQAEARETALRETLEDMFCGPHVTGEVAITEPCPEGFDLGHHCKAARRALSGEGRDA